jgi:hypothetical protein
LWAPAEAREALRGGEKHGQVSQQEDGIFQSVMESGAKDAAKQEVNLAGLAISRIDLVLSG